MIKIDEIRKEKYKFPTIDFKFQNSGNATAFLWQFTIDILQAKVNTTPDLRFTSSVYENNLALKISNYGWGKAQNCTIEFIEPNLEILLHPSSRQFKVDIASGENASLTLRADALNQTKFREILSNPVKSSRAQNGILSLFGSEKEENRRNISTIELDRIQAHWNCISDDGQNLSGISDVSISGDYSIGVTSNGFVRTNEYSIQACMMGSDTTYITMIDPSQGSQKRQYPISRQIPPGGIERFHIMVGATKSCDLKVKFKFAIDKSTMVESDEFEIQIYNPQNSSFSNYRDGDQIDRQIEELERKIEQYAQPGELSYRGYWEKGEVERLKRRVKTYPFVPSQNDNDSY